LILTPGNWKQVAILAVLWAGAALPAAATDPAPSPPPAEGDDLSLDPVVFINDNRDFQIIFPGGCGKLVAKFNEPDLWGGQSWDEIIQVTHVYCDRYQKDGEGCSVNATFNMTDQDGSMAGPPQVKKLVTETLKGFGAKIVDQQSIKKEYENGVFVEGVEVFAQAPMGKGEVWIRGLLADGDIYILTAWNDQGGLWKDPDYLAFFNSFQPWVD
jgi:hypothetical protein